MVEYVVARGMSCCGCCVEIIVSVTVVSESYRAGGCCVEALVSVTVVSGSVVLGCLALSPTLCYGEGRGGSK